MSHQIDYLRIIGDVHGHINRYIEISKKTKYSICVGDMGFNYEGLQYLDAEQHVFVGGNHDNYTTAPNYPHYLGDFGVRQLGTYKFFFVRGAFSIDKKGRLYHEWSSGRKCWWPQEELTYSEGLKALDLYRKVKPKVVISHTCPLKIVKMVGSDGALLAFGHDPKTFRTSTSVLLQSMWEIHQPNYWFFGHFHRDWKAAVDNTLFVCISELNYIRINGKGKMI